MADIPASTWSETDASNNTASPDGAPEGMAPGGVNDTMRMMMGALKRWYDWTIPKTTAGTSTAYTLSYSVAPTALVDGMPHLVLFNAASGASPTLNVNSLGAKPIYQYVGGAWAQVTTAGLITANSVHRLVYNSSDGAYRVIGSASPIGAAFLAAVNTFTAACTFSAAATFSSTVALGASATATTQAQADNDTSVATTGYADRVGVQQIVSSITGAVATGTTTMPIDDTIPQNTEGDEYMTLAITPKSATSKLRISVLGNFNASVSELIGMALFQDSTAGALSAVVSAPINISGTPFETQIKLEHVMTSGTTSATTFKVRAGMGSAGTLSFNGNGGSRLFGGVNSSSIIIEEIGI